MGKNVDQAVALFHDSKVKGGGNIARTVASALEEDARWYLASGQHGDLKLNVQQWGAQIIRARPSQITLRNTVKNILYRIEKINDDDDQKVLDAILTNSKLFIETVDGAKENISILGANLLQDGDIVLTNSYSQMVKAIIDAAVNTLGKEISVIITETRPKNQGYRMVKELLDIGVPCTLITDSAVRHIMRKVDIVIFGTDTVSSDGSAITKIGSSVIALAANEARVPLYIAAPTFKFSEDTLSGVMVGIEEGNPMDIVRGSSLEEEIDNPLLTIANPTFDATPPEFIRGIITELYVMSPFSVGEYLARKSGLIE